MKAQILKKITKPTLVRGLGWGSRDVASVTSRTLYTLSTSGVTQGEKSLVIRFLGVSSKKNGFLAVSRFLYPDLTNQSRF
jgi:hypothetical protein